MMNSEVFQKVFDIISPYLPENWDKMVVFAGYTEGSYNITYYSRDEIGFYTDCFSQKILDRIQLLKLFKEVNKVLSAERQSLPDKQRWTVMTMMVESNGHMKAEYDYADISENMIDYKQEWEEKYLV